MLLIWINTISIAEAHNFNGSCLAPVLIFHLCSVFPIFHLCSVFLIFHLCSVRLERSDRKSELLHIIRFDNTRASYLGFHFTHCNLQGSSFFFSELIHFLLLRLYVLRKRRHQEVKKTFKMKHFKWYDYGFWNTITKIGQSKCYIAVQIVVRMHGIPSSSAAYNLF